MAPRVNSLIFRGDQREDSGVLYNFELLQELRGTEEVQEGRPERDDKIDQGEVAQREGDGGVDRKYTQRMIYVCL